MMARRVSASDFGNLPAVADRIRAAARERAAAAPASRGGEAAAGLVRSTTSVPAGDLALDQFCFSAAAVRQQQLEKTIRLSAQALTELFSEHVFSMYTLTLKSGQKYEPRMISDFLKFVRRYFQKHGLGQLNYCWVAELQPTRAEAAAALHFHVLIAFPRSFYSAAVTKAAVRGYDQVALSFGLPKADTLGWWRHGHTQAEWALCPVSYLKKYVSKAQPREEEGEGSGFAAKRHTFPRGARTYGVGGLSALAKSVLRWNKLPAYLRDFSVPADDWRRAEGGGFSSQPRGLHLQSAFRWVGTEAGVTTIKRLGDLKTWFHRKTTDLGSWRDYLAAARVRRDHADYQGAVSSPGDFMSLDSKPPSPKPQLELEDADGMRLVIDKRRHFRFFDAAPPEVEDVATLSLFAPPASLRSAYLEALWSRA